MKKPPIGFLDSGVGGFSILNTLAHTLPTDTIIYFADAKYLPYGQKSYAFLLERATYITKYFEEQDVATIYVACHTLSSTVLPELKTLFPHITYVDCLPPTITNALEQSKTKQIGVMATSTSIASGTHKRLLQAANPTCTIIEQACPLFVDLIERQAPEQELSEAITLYLQPLKEARVDTIILGCTHYWFIQHIIQKQAPNLIFISAASALTLQSTERNTKDILFVTTASPQYIKQGVSWYCAHTTCCSITFANELPFTNVNHPHHLNI